MNKIYPSRFVHISIDVKTGKTKSEIQDAVSKLGDKLRDKEAGRGSLSFTLSEFHETEISMDKHVLSSQKVDYVYQQCMYRGEIGCPTTDILGVKMKSTFRLDKLWKYRQNIILMLDELPAPFHVGSGDGWTFLNMCVDKNGRQWCDSHLVCDMLVCLGIAIGAVEFTLPDREAWPALAGGMPYITVNTKKSAL